MENNLYKQAIVDAKAVRASAIANAKATLQEAIEPKIQEMMRLKLSEELEESDLEVSEGLPEDVTEDMDPTETQDESIDETTLEEILDELNSLEEDYSENELEESYIEEKKEESEEEDEEEEEEEEEVGGDDEAAMETEEPTDDTKVIDLTLGDLKQVMQSIQAGGGEVSMDDMEIDDMEMDPEAMPGEEPKGDEPLSLDEVLAELERQTAGLSEKKEGEEELEEKKEKGEDEELEEKLKKVEDELEEAQDAIITLNETLKELNLLNAKLLFANKILRAKNLNESEKSRVIKAFDRTRTVKETQNTYETLMESLSTKKTKPAEQLKESIGFASKPAGVAPKSHNPIVESDGFVNRWKVIAGIK